MVTNLFSEDEPLRIALRREAVSLLTHTDTFQITKLRDMLRLSGDVGIISDINTKILLEALDTLKDVDVAKKDTLEIAPILKVSNNTTIKDTHTDIDTTEVDDTLVSEVSQDQPVSLYANPQVHDQIIINTKAQKTSVPKPAISSVVALDIGARRKKILEVVKSKGQATIHEFIESIQGCSSKTIQRELTSLVLSGTLKKTGERRWSRYSLK